MKRWLMGMLFVGMVNFLSLPAGVNAEAVEKIYSEAEVHWSGEALDEYNLEKLEFYGLFGSENLKFRMIWYVPKEFSRVDSEIDMKWFMGYFSFGGTNEVWEQGDGLLLKNETGEFRSGSVKIGFALTPEGALEGVGAERIEVVKYGKVFAKLRGGQAEFPRGEMGSYEGDWGLVSSDSSRSGTLQVFYQTKNTIGCSMILKNGESTKRFYGPLVWKDGKTAEINDTTGSSMTLHLEGDRIRVTTKGPRSEGYEGEFVRKAD